MGVLSESLPGATAVATANADARHHHAWEGGDDDVEAAWIDAARDDPQAFAPLYDRYATPVYRFCYRKVGDPDVANDLTTQVFIRAIERLDRYTHRDGATFRSWLFTIARNTVTDRWRRFRPTRPLEPVVLTLADQEPGPEERAVHSDELSHLLAVLDQLSDNQRDIIELRLAGLTTTEVGNALGMSRPAVKSAQSRAYKRLRHHGNSTSPDDQHLHQDARTDAPRNDADALDAWLNEMARNDGFASPRSGNRHDRPPVRNDDHGGRDDTGSLTATAASFHQRIEAAQARHTHAAAPDPHLWEKIMDRTPAQPPATVAATTTPANPWRETKPSNGQTSSVPRRGQLPHTSGFRRQQTWNMVANIGLVIAIVLAGFGVWRLSGEPGLPSGAGDDPNVPGVAMQPSALDATPEATGEPAVSAPLIATSQPATDCDFGSDIPIFTGVESSPIEDTAVMLTPDGELVLTCAEEPQDTTLASGVANAAPGEWPGIVWIDYEAEEPQDRQPAVINLLTGDIVDIGTDPEAMQILHRQPTDSPWLISADQDDYTRWKITDLRTMESRFVSELGDGQFPAGAGIITASNGAGGTALFAAQAPFTENGGGEIVNGQVLVIEGSLDNSRWLTLPAELAPETDIVMSPDGQHLAATSNPVEGEASRQSLPDTTKTYSILRVADGQEVSRSEAFDDRHETTMQWVQGGDALVYTRYTSLMLLRAEANAEPVALIEGNHLLRVEGLTIDPDMVLVSRQPTGDDATVDPMGEEIHLYAVNTTTGDMITMQGRDVSNNVDWWEPATRFVVMYQPRLGKPDTITYHVLNATTGEQIAELVDVPLTDRGVAGIAYPDLGLHSVVGAMDGDIEIMAFDSRHIYLMRMVAGMLEVRQIASPPGLLSGASLMASMFLSPDGSMLSLTGEGDESRTRWLLPLDGEPDEWIEVPTTEPGEGPEYLLFVRGTGD